MTTERIIPSSNSKAIREKVETWHRAHREQYNAFKKQTEGVGKMNPAFFMKLMSFAMDCIPKDRLDVCSYIFRLGCGDIPPDEETPEYIRQYDTIVKEFLEGGKVITIDVDTGEVRCYKPEPHEVFDMRTCVIINDYFEQLKASRPELLRRYLDDLYAQLDEERAAIDKDRNVRSSEVFFDMAHQISFIYAMILAPEVLRNMESMGEHADDDFPTVSITTVPLTGV